MQAYRLVAEEVHNVGVAIGCRQMERRALIVVTRVGGHAIVDQQLCVSKVAIHTRLEQGTYRVQLWYDNTTVQLFIMLLRSKQTCLHVPAALRCSTVCQCCKLPPQLAGKGLQEYTVKDRDHQDCHASHVNAKWQPSGPLSCL